MPDRDESQILLAPQPGTGRAHRGHDVRHLRCIVASFDQFLVGRAACLQLRPHADAVYLPADQLPQRLRPLELEHPKLDAR